MSDGMGNGARIYVDYYVGSLGLGSITTLTMTEDDKRVAEEKEKQKRPVGFANYKGEGKVEGADQA